MCLWKWLWQTYDRWCKWIAECWVFRQSAIYSVGSATEVSRLHEGKDAGVHAMQNAKTKQQRSRLIFKRIPTCTRLRYHHKNTHMQCPLRAAIDLGTFGKWWGLWLAGQQYCSHGGIDESAGAAREIDFQSGSQRFFFDFFLVGSCSLPFVFLVDMRAHMSFVYWFFSRSIMHQHGSVVLQTLEINTKLSQQQSTLEEKLQKIEEANDSVSRWPCLKSGPGNAWSAVCVDFGSEMLLPWVSAHFKFLLAVLESVLLFV